MKCLLFLTFLALVVCDVSFSVPYFYSINGKKSKKMKTFSALPSEIQVSVSSIANGGVYKVFIEEDTLYIDEIKNTVHKTKTTDCILAQSDYAFYLKDLCDFTFDSVTGKYQLKINPPETKIYSCDVKADSDEASLECNVEGKTYLFTRVFPTSAGKVNIYGKKEFNKLKDLDEEVTSNTRADGEDTDTTDEIDDKEYYNFEEGKIVADTNYISTFGQYIINHQNAKHSLDKENKKGLIKLGATIYRCDLESKNSNICNKMHVCSYDGTDIYCKDQVFDFSLNRGISIACLVIIALISILF